jgi:hypothetical protein
MLNEELARKAVEAGAEAHAELAECDKPIPYTLTPEAVVNVASLEVELGDAKFLEVPAREAADLREVRASAKAVADELQQLRQSSFEETERLRAELGRAIHDRDEHARKLRETAASRLHDDLIKLKEVNAEWQEHERVLKLASEALEESFQQAFAALGKNEGEGIQDAARRVASELETERLAHQQVSEVLYDVSRILDKDDEETVQDAARRAVADAAWARGWRDAVRMVQAHAGRMVDAFRGRRE